MAPAERPPLWTCPRCGARLAGRNMAHACGAYSVEKFLAGKGPTARALFEGFAALAAACGDVTPAPAKTRVAFMARIRFTAVNAVSENGLSAHILFRERKDHPRFRRVDAPSSGMFVHHLRIRHVDELDAQLAEWLQESHDTVGV